MAIDIISDRLNSYKIETKQAELNAIKEVSQEVALACSGPDGYCQARVGNSAAYNVIIQRA